MATHNVILQGAGGHARVVLDCARAQGHNVVSIYDPTAVNPKFYGVPLRTEYKPEMDPGTYAIVAVGDNAIRKKVATSTGHPFTNVIHPSALISSHTTIGVGNVLLHGSIIQAETKIGSHVIINTGSQADHDCVVGDFVHLAPGVVLCGNVQIGEGSFIGAGTTVIPGRKIGAWSIVGAGSVVVRDIPDFAVAFGNPARIIKYINR